MFETLFTCPGALRRHRAGPLADQRAAYLEGLAAQQVPQGTILRKARYCLCVANELQRWSQDHSFGQEEVNELARSWAAERVTNGRASIEKWPTEGFRLVAGEFLHSLGRLRAPPSAPSGRYQAELAYFIAAQKEGPWQSEVTCRSACWQINKFLEYLEQRNIDLKQLAAVDVDAYFQQMSQSWSRSSLQTSAKFLRSWFNYCETRGWVQFGLGDAILMPRIYREEGLPLGPTWEEIGRMLADSSGNRSAQLRNQAILLLFSVYGLRSGEVRRLQIDDIDWKREQIRVVRSKTGRKETLPIEPRVGNALARYLCHGRPKSDSRVVFLTLHAPYRQLSTSALYGIVERRLSKHASPNKGRGPHSLRHACARHLRESGRSFKEVGDHLGHRSPDAPHIYAKVDLKSLRQVAFQDLGGLT